MSFFVVPVDIPPLPGMNIDHFLTVDLEDVKLFVSRDELLNLIQWTEIHKITSIQGIISAKFLVGAKITPPLQALVFQVVTDQRSIMNNF